MLDISTLTVDEIKEGINSGKYVLHKKRLFLAEDYEVLKDAIRQEEHYDLLQLTKKIQL